MSVVPLVGGSSSDCGNLITSLPCLFPGFIGVTPYVSR